MIPGVPVPPGIADLQRRYFGTGPDLDEAERARCQAWHEEQKHRDHPANGTCFCCCQECDPQW